MWQNGGWTWAVSSRMLWSRYRSLFHSLPLLSHSIFSWEPMASCLLMSDRISDGLQVQRDPSGADRQWFWLWRLWMRSQEGGKGYKCVSGAADCCSSWIYATQRKKCHDVAHVWCRSLESTPCNLSAGRDFDWNIAYHLQISFLTYSITYADYILHFEGTIASSRSFVVQESTRPKW